MKICDLCMLYYPHGGGIKTYINNKRKIYKERGIRHVLIAPNFNNPKKLEKLEEGSTIIYYIPCIQIRIFGTSYYIFKGFKKIKEILNKEKPNILEIGDKITTLLFKNKINKIYNIKIFGFSHERSDNFAKTVIGIKIIGYFFSELFSRRFVQSVDGVITNSDFTGEELIKYLPKNKINIINLGIDLDNFKKEKYYDKDLYNKLSDNGRKKLLIHVGRLDKDKKINLLIDIAKKLDSNKYKLIVIGSGSMEKELQKNHAVMLTGYISSRDVRRYLAVSDIGILVNNIEPYGLVGIEMMAMGLPILGPNKGGLITFLRKDFSFLCNNNQKSYLNSLYYWEKLSKEQKEKMEERAFVESQKYTLDNMVDQLIDIYKK